MKKIISAYRMKPRRTDGFTLFEFMIVVLIMAIFAMLGWPVLSSALRDYRLEAAAEEIVNAMEFAQLTATAGQQTQVTINATTKRIDVKRYKPTADLLSGLSQYPAAEVEADIFVYLENPMNKGTDYSIVLTNDSRFSGVDITASAFDPPDPVTFDSTGTPSKGGTVTLVFAGRQKVVTLNAVTGRVSVSG